MARMRRAHGRHEGGVVAARKTALLVEQCEETDPPLEKLERRPIRRVLA